ncbi:MAG: M24 family metallopeptidase, partial [Spirochaetales bacterium]|nr:M24 family metallopeptidase [Spirochaetales bacterium]
LDEATDAGRDLDELAAAEQLRRFRREDASYVSDSFNYISGFDANGAIIHYAVDPASPAPFSARGVYLTDSGAQYRDGTTDITRTVAIGTPEQAVVDDFSLVLKGHIALARLVFPRLTAGGTIDAIARQHLWAQMCNYGHGTGHGVGYVLNVHEGPQKIAPQAPPWPLEVGMIVSNEPGLYRAGRYGIRIENLLAVTEAGESEFGRFLTFETLTLCPIDRRLIDPDALNDAERAWLDDYHARVRDALSEGLDERERAWLEEATRPL